jgi:hypothetical protein
LFLFWLFAKIFIRNMRTGFRVQLVKCIQIGRWWSRAWFVMTNIFKCRNILCVCCFFHFLDRWSPSNILLHAITVIVRGVSLKSFPAKNEFNSYNCWILAIKPFKMFFVLVESKYNRKEIIFWRYLQYIKIGYLKEKPCGNWLYCLYLNDIIK